MSGAYLIHTRTDVCILCQVSSGGCQVHVMHVGVRCTLGGCRVGQVSVRCTAGGCQMHVKWVSGAHQVGIMQVHIKIHTWGMSGVLVLEKKSALNFVGVSTSQFLRP